MRGLGSSITDLFFCITMKSPLGFENPAVNQCLRLPVYGEAFCTFNFSFLTFTPALMELAAFPCVGLNLPPPT